MDTITLHHNKKFLSTEILRLLKRECPPSLLAWSDRWEMPDAYMLIVNPALAFKVESIFRRLYKEPLVREPDWYRELRQKIASGAIISLNTGYGSDIKCSGKCRSCNAVKKSVERHYKKQRRVTTCPL